jgi:hypothetical protein
MFSKARYRMIELEKSMMSEININKFSIIRRVFGVEVSFTCWENWLKICTLTDEMLLVFDMVLWDYMSLADLKPKASSPL